MALKKVFDVLKEEPEEAKEVKTAKPKVEKVKKEEPKSENTENYSAETKNYDDLPIIKKSMTVHLLHELAINEFKDRTNIKRQREKGKRMNDAEMWQHILDKFFEMEENRNCLKAAEAKLNDQ